MSWIGVRRHSGRSAVVGWSDDKVQAEDGQPQEQVCCATPMSPRWPIVNCVSTVSVGAFVIRGWLGSRVVSVLESGAEGPAGSNRSRDAVG